MIPPMRITLNGEQHEVPADSSVADLVQQLELSGKRVAVEVNREIVRRAEHHQRVLEEDDTVEVVTLVGGG